MTTPAFYAAATSCLTCGGKRRIRLDQPVRRDLPGAYIACPDCTPAALRAVMAAFDTRETF